MVFMVAVVVERTAVVDLAAAGCAAAEVSAVVGNSAEAHPLDLSEADHRRERFVGDRTPAADRLAEAQMRAALDLLPIEA